MHIPGIKLQTDLIMEIPQSTRWRIVEKNPSVMSRLFPENVETDGGWDCYVEYNPVLKPHCLLFLGAFAKLRKATISFVMSVCPYETTRVLLHEFW
jgi:hypothetical protein